mgnify:CR=1 FL=1
MQRILVVEDDFDIQELLQNFLQEAGYEVAVANDGVEALSLFAGERYDLIVLDIMLPKIDGYGVCELIRKQSDVPIIMLTALSGEEDQIKGLDLQVDDYITKPFNILEVKARIKAIIRRTAKQEKKADTAGRIQAGDMTIERDNRRVYIEGREINLTAKEFDVLELLATHPNQVYSREKLLTMVWGADYPGDARTVDVHIRRLREKVETNSSEPKYVHTKWGVGYYFKG